MPDKQIISWVEEKSANPVFFNFETHADQDGWNPFRDDNLWYLIRDIFCRAYFFRAKELKSIQDGLPAWEEVNHDHDEVAAYSVIQLSIFGV